MLYLNENELLKAACSKEASRLFLGMIMTETGVLSPTARLTPEQTYLCEGERNVGLRIFRAYLSAGLDPIKSMKEYNEWVEQLEKNAEEKKEEV